jgi:hypothetical protein
MPAVRSRITMRSDATAGLCMRRNAPSGTVRLTIKARPRSYTTAMPTARDLSTSAIAFLRR